MRRYRTLAGIAAALIVAAGALAVSSGGTPALPPPMTLRGQAPSTSITVADTGLEFVPPTVVDMAPSTSTSLGSNAADTASSPDATPEDDHDTLDTLDTPDLPDTPDLSDTVDSPDDED